MLAAIRGIQCSNGVEATQAWVKADDNGTLYEFGILFASGSEEAPSTNLYIASFLLCMYACNLSFYLPSVGRGLLVLFISGDGNASSCYYHPVQRQLVLHLVVMH